MKLRLRLKGCGLGDVCYRINKKSSNNNERSTRLIRRDNKKRKQAARFKYYKLYLNIYIYIII